MKQFWRISVVLGHPAGSGVGQEVAEWLVESDAQPTDTELSLAALSFNLLETGVPTPITFSRLRLSNHIQTPNKPDFECEGLRIWVVWRAGK